jgi:cytochrome c oxidase cbb3-type subunit I/II
MITLGVPYPENYASQANADLMKQAGEIAENLSKDRIKTAPNKEIVAIIAYLQRLGTYIKLEKKDDSAIK